MIGKKKGFFSQPDGSADLRSPEKEVYFRSWDFAHHQIYKSSLDTQNLNPTQINVKGKSKECIRKG